MAQRVISFHYTLTDVEGDELDSSAGTEPLTFMEGVGQIIPGLEKALAALKKGDKSVIAVAAVDAYGDRDEELLMAVPKDKLPKPDVKVGDQFRAGDAAHGMPFTVVEVREADIVLDGNHPLAGMDLKFDVEVVEIRDATDEEVAHGHAHGPGGHDH